MTLKNVRTQKIETERLYLRRFDSGYAEGMFKNWINDRLVQSNYGEPVYENIGQIAFCSIRHYADIEYCISSILTPLIYSYYLDYDAYIEGLLMK